MLRRERVHQRSIRGGEGEVNRALGGQALGQPEVRLPLHPEATDLVLYFHDHPVAERLERARVESLALLVVSHGNGDVIQHRAFPREFFQSGS